MSRVKVRKEHEELKRQYNICCKDENSINIGFVCFFIKDDYLKKQNKHVWAYLSKQEQEMLKYAVEYHDTKSLLKKSKISVLVQRKTCITVCLDIPVFEIRI